MRIARPPIMAARPARAFTLIEIVVVVTVLAILAALIMPRFTGNEKREFKNAVDQVGDLLTMFAQRHNLGQKVVGLYHNTARNWLELVVLDTDGASGDSMAYWQPDRYVKPVRLPGSIHESDVIVEVDGYKYDMGDSPLNVEIGQERPLIQITLRGAGENATLSLPPYGVAPAVSATYGSSGTIRTKYDLDAAGRSREDW